MKGGLFLSDKEWAVIEPVLPKGKRRRDGRGRPPKDPRSVFNGIIWILVSGAPWYMLPKDVYPPYQTCHRYFQKWVRAGVMQKLLYNLSVLYRKNYNLSVPSFVDATFVSAKKGGRKLAKPGGARAPRSWH